MVGSVVAVEYTCRHGFDGSVEFDYDCSTPASCCFAFFVYADTGVVEEGNDAYCLVFVYVSCIVLP